MLRPLPPKLEPLIDPRWLTSNVCDLLNAHIDDPHNEQRLPIIADALMEAGCDCEPLLRALRHPGEKSSEIFCAFHLDARNGCFGRNPAVLLEHVHDICNPENSRTHRLMRATGAAMAEFRGRIILDIMIYGELRYKVHPDGSLEYLPYDD